MEAAVGDVPSGDLQSSSSTNGSRTKTTVSYRRRLQFPSTFLIPWLHQLDRNNNVLWFIVVEMYIAGRDKLGYIKGELTPPASIDPLFQKRVNRKRHC